MLVHRDGPDIVHRSSVELVVKVVLQVSPTNSANSNSGSVSD